MVFEKKSVQIFLTSDNFSFVAFVLFLSYSLIRQLSSYAGLDINLVGYIVIILTYGFLGLSLIMKKPACFNQSLVFVVTIFFVLLFSMLFHPENGNALTKGLALQRGVIAVLFVCSIDNPKQIKYSINILAFLSVLEVIISLITYFTNGGNWITTSHGVIKYANYNMTLGYNATFAAILIIQQFLKDKKIYKLFLFLALFLISFIFGSRGCLLCYAVLALILFRNALKNKFIFFCILLFVFAVVLLFFTIGTDILISTLINLLDKLGLESRTLEYFFSNSLDMSGRDELWRVMVEKIAENPFFGYGIFGEQHFFKTMYGEEYFAHNIILELLTSFGIPLGIFICIALFWCCFRARNILKGTNIEIAYITLLAYNIGNLMVSNTFWYSTNFWIMIGLIVVAFTRKAQFSERFNSKNVFGTKRSFDLVSNLD